ncbi:MAG: hypothetical protein AMS27_01670 [Bacteroides sp. SM23_62_1]|nr:MAG: hypothetical protein AMS27_01670 [Bacteroides sp. SM23_62_1]
MLLLFQNVINMSIGSQATTRNKEPGTGNHITPHPIPSPTRNQEPGTGNYTTQHPIPLPTRNQELETILPHTQFPHAPGTEN